MPRIQAVVRLYLFSIFGVFLVAAPWTPLWEQAGAVFGPTGLGDWLQSGWVRGAASGIGAVDLLVASQEALDLWRVYRGHAEGEPT